MKYVNHIMGAGHVTMIFSDRDPINILSDNPQYHAIVGCLRQQQFDKAATLADRASMVAETTKGKFVVRNGVIVIDGELIPRVLSNRLLQFVEHHLDTSALENFWDNLKENPSEESKKDLFLFLEKNHIPLTEDGCFIGYKKVNDDFTDCHTGSIDNTPGIVVRMPRDKVSADRTVHCGPGLHVADFSYADKAMGTGVMLKVKVHPKDVVSVPNDHNAKKMRVCRYQSLEVYGDDVEIPEQLVVEPTEAKEVKRRVVGKRAKSAVLKADKEGRIRIPGKIMRQIGAGVGHKVKAFVNNVRSRNVMVVFHKTNATFHASNEYRVGDDNSIRLSPSFLRNAKIDGYDEYKVRLKDDALEIRVN
tara:strand:- start:113630 stop:114712 length:1083 start_codon:yes stop_codon:yes gene_type:complete